MSGRGARVILLLHNWYSAWYDGGAWAETLNLSHDGILESQVVPSVDEQLVLEMLRRVKVLAGRLLTVTSTLDRVVASGDASVLDLDVGRRVSELALRVRPRALVPLELAAHLQLEPARILDVEEVVDVHHCHVGHPRAHHGAVGGAVRGGGGCGRGIQLAGSRDSRRSLTTPPINARTTAVKAAAAGVEEQAASVLVMWWVVVKW